MTTPPDAQLALRVTGRVQGVGFRYFVRTQARRHNLTGWVRNEPDGSVYAIAEGPREHLEAFLDQIRQGPSMAAVSHVQTQWLPATGTFSRFSVQYF